MNIWDKILNFQERTERRIINNIDRNTAAFKQKTSGPRWRPVKIAAGVLAVAGAIGLIFTYWGILVLIFIISVILGLAAKS